MNRRKHRMRNFREGWWLSSCHGSGTEHWRLKSEVQLPATAGDRFFGPSSTWTVQSSLDNADAHMPFTQGCPSLLIDSPTGHYNSTGMYSTSLGLAFLASVQKGRALESAFVALNSKYVLPCLLEIYTCISEAFEIQMPLYSRHAVVVPGGPIVLMKESFAVLCILQVAWLVYASHNLQTGLSRIFKIN